MLPYEILVGFRRTMCTSARGLMGKQTLLRNLNVDVKSFHNISDLLHQNLFNSSIPRNKINTNHIRRFHTQLLASCQASPKDSKPSEYDNISSFTNELIDDLAELKEPKKANRKVTKKSDGIHSSNANKSIPESVQKWLYGEAEKSPSRDIEKKFPESKAFLHNMFMIVSNETKIPQPLTTSSRAIDMNKKRLWSYTYEIKWPEPKVFHATAHSKGSASSAAALKVLYWLHLNNRIQNRMPVVYEKKEAKSVMNAPKEFTVDSNILKKIDDFLNKYEDNIKEIPLESENSEPFTVTHPNSNRQHPISHLRAHHDSRSQILQDRLENRTSVVNPDLPIFKFKSQILSELEGNQALVIKGDTGCGKTTQVPQFILDSLTEKGMGAECSMVVTQPRRISAISLAKRIAFERNEDVGDVVGYQVRLQQVLPKQNGAILFCTTGVLLKKMQSNLPLTGLTHVIIDEAHERNVDTDMLLALLKRSMELNPSLKVIIMSATINADLFQKYLNCNSVEVPGKVFPVQMNFLEDITSLGVSRPRAAEDIEGAFVDCESIVELISYISKNKPPGAILCFLPGWHHIQSIQKTLESSFFGQFAIIPLHSRVPYNIQNQAFESAPKGQRKIILATDIAETGITVPDVVYVVDSACHRETRWHENKGLSSINIHWVSQANINQRKGRAGRVQKGESYHFITKRAYEDLEPYPVPEVLRVSLEKTVLDCKTYSDEKPHEFLSSMPQPPRLTSVKKAVSDLQVLGALDDDENLTHLGRRIAHFTVHPKLSKAMVYATIFRCLQPVSSIATFLSIDSDLFYGVLDNKSRVRRVKEQFHPTSDHLAIAWIYTQWLNYNAEGTRSAINFCKRNSIHGDRMLIMHRMQEIHMGCLSQTGLIGDVVASSDLHSKENEFAALDELVRGILLTGTDQLLKHRDFEFRKGRFTKSGTSMVTEDDARAQLSPECVNYKRSSWPSPYLTYYQKTHHSEMRTTLIRESSIVSPVTVLLFSQGRVTGSLYHHEEDKQDKILLRIDGKENLNLLCDENTAKTLLRFRDIIWIIARYFVVNNVDERWYDVDDSEGSDTNNIVKYRKEMLDVLASLLTSASSEIDALHDKSESDDETSWESPTNFSNPSFMGERSERRGNSRTSSFARGRSGRRSDSMTTSFYADRSGDYRKLTARSLMYDEEDNNR